MNTTEFPFGMLFEEPLPKPAEEGLIVPKYDPFEGLSYIDYEGQRLPYITYSWVVTGTQTGTSTKAELDSDDIDEHLSSVGNPVPVISTQTITKIREETTDLD